MKCETLVNLTDEKITYEVSRSQDRESIVLAFYRKKKDWDESLALQLEVNRDDIELLPDSLLHAIGCEDTGELEDKILKLRVENEELKEIVEQYEENNQAYREKLQVSEGIF